MRIFQPYSKRIRNAEKMTLFSQENNISPNQKYKITELYLYRPSTKSLWNTYSIGFLISLRSRLLFKHFYTINVTFELKILRALSVVTRERAYKFKRKGPLKTIWLCSNGKTCMDLNAQRCLSKLCFWVTKNLVANLVSVELELLNKVIFDVGFETKNLGQRNKETSWVFTTGVFSSTSSKRSSCHPAPTRPKSKITLDSHNNIALDSSESFKC